MRRITPALLALAALALVPLASPSGYLLHMLIVVFLYVILAAGLDLVMGYCGQYSFAQGAFYGIGAYTAAILHRDLGLDFWQTLPLGVLSAGAFGLLLGIPSLRLSGHFLSITTIAFQTIIYLLLTQWTSFTGGQYGLPVPKVGTLSLFGHELFRIEKVREFYFLALAVMAVALLVAWRLATSRIGREWRAIHDDELVARAIGISVTRDKLVAFVASAALAGAAGVLVAYYLEGVSPTDFSIWTSATVVAMVIVGGRGTIFGPAAGAIVFTLMPEVLRATADYKLIIFGVLMIVMVIFMPMGAAGLLRRERS
ncbi:MAG: branched-chain amino acid ABC transporter permease [Alphaproteobacteria bacterium]